MHSMCAESHIFGLKGSISSSSLQLSAQGVQLSGEVSFVKFEWLVLGLPAVNQRLSNSVFSVSSYIPVLR